MVSCDGDQKGNRQSTGGKRDCTGMGSSYRGIVEVSVSGGAVINRACVDGSLIIEQLLSVLRSRDNDLS